MSANARGGPKTGKRWQTERWRCYVSASAAEQPHRPGRLSRSGESLDEQAHRRGIQPIRSVDDMARDDVFETDEELDAFLAHIYTERHANLV